MVKYNVVAYSPTGECEILAENIEKEDAIILSKQQEPEKWLYLQNEDEKE